MFRRRKNTTTRVAAAAAADDFARQTSYLIPAEVRLIAACHSIQSSVDAAAAYEGGLPDPMNKAGGACTAALLGLLYHHHHTTTTTSQNGNANTNAAATDKKNHPLTFQQVLLELRQRLAKQGYEQIPQLTSSRPLELQKTPFDLGPSNPNGGTKRALLVGINYYGQQGALTGCHNDVYSVQHYLKTVQGYKDQHIVLLADAPHAKHLSPTKHEIIRALQLLVQDSMPGDAVYFHYSGHGGLLFPEANDFKAKSYKGYNDETIYPVDHAYAGQITDFSLFRHFVQPMRAGVRVTVVMDCCHCGTVLELPYSFQPTAAAAAAVAETTIPMRQSMDALANLAFLHVLAGNRLPAVGFDDLVQHVQNATGNDLQDYQGIGLALEDAVGTLAENSDKNNNINGGGGGLASNSFDEMAAQGQQHDGTAGYEIVDNPNDNYRDDSESGGGMDCDCLGGGIFSFLLGLLGGGGGGNDDDDDDDY